MKEKAVSRVEQIEAVVTEVLHSQRNRDFIIAVRGGSVKATEHYAYPYILPLVDERNEKLALRLAGIMTSSQIPHNKDLSFGEWLRKNDISDRRILALSTLSLDQAIDEIKRLLRMKRYDQLGFDWYALGRTLFYWGNGVSDGSLKARQSIIKDYFRVSSKNKSEENREEEQ